jgi:hypothetical protein
MTQIASKKRCVSMLTVYERHKMRMRITPAQVHALDRKMSRTAKQTMTALNLVSR